MEFLQLLYFCSAAETENFAQTAKTYGVPATSISQSVRRLEKELDVTLFDRVANGVKLNERGKMFYVNAKSSLDMLNDAKKKVKEEEIEGMINVLVEANRYLVNEVIFAFCKEHKNVKFNIDYERKGNINKYDLMITDNQRYTESNQITRLVSEDIVLALNKNHPLATKEKIEIVDLKNEDFIIYNEDCAMFTLIRQICRMGDFDPKIKIRIDDPYGLAQCVEEGLGIAMIPRVAYKDLFSDNVVLREFVDKKRSTVICYSRKKYMSKSTKLFMELLFKSVEKYS